MQKDTVIYPCI